MWFPQRALKPLHPSRPPMQATISILSANSAERDGQETRPRSPPAILPALKFRPVSRMPATMAVSTRVMPESAGTEYPNGHQSSTASKPAPSPRPDAQARAGPAMECCGLRCTSFLRHQRAGFYGPPRRDGAAAAKPPLVDLSLPIGATKRRQDQTDCQVGRGTCMDAAGRCYGNRLTHSLAYTVVTGGLHLDQFEMGEHGPVPQARSTAKRPRLRPRRQLRLAHFEGLTPLPEASLAVVPQHPAAPSSSLSGKVTVLMIFESLSSMNSFGRGRSITGARMNFGKPGQNGY
jgi:hypothetical protein